MNMEVLKGSGLNADTIEIIINDGSHEIFKKKYYYGYNVSYKDVFVTEDKPLDKDLIKDIANQYNIPFDSITYGQGVNIFKGQL
jgi:hypothetical protein